MDVLLLIRRLLVIAALGASMAGCTGVFFQPYRTLVRTPDDIGLAYEDVRFKTADGVVLHGWFLPANATACATVLFLHGNAENISTHIGSVYWMPRYGFNVFLPDYRGYGASSGTPSL
ncbi:MAG: alpha/beta hydrolase, partial [Sulfurifustaceae bacterium]